MNSFAPVTTSSFLRRGAPIICDGLHRSKSGTIASCISFAEKGLRGYSCSMLMLIYISRGVVRGASGGHVGSLRGKLNQQCVIPDQRSDQGLAFLTDIQDFSSLRGHNV